ncbi:hypothetical protein [Agrobacterium rosae]|uniref:hypothetical protein n=1 Tax=Agrobacterium rosae TaxID=1972867 RepID=UPI001178C958|nr:hypothetical protein [Agrobacterium rosae]
MSFFDGAGTNVGGVSTDGVKTTVRGPSGSAFHVQAGSASTADFISAGRGYLTGESGITLVNRQNNNIVLPANSGQFIMTGPTADFSISGISGGIAGREIVLFNAVPYSFTIMLARQPAIAFTLLVRLRSVAADVL